MTQTHRPSHISSQCIPINASSKLPIFAYKTENRHGWDGIFIRMVKLCRKSIAFPLNLLFQSSLDTVLFPVDWKEGNIVPVHKTENENLIENYRPISLLPIFSKIYARLIFNSIFNYFIKNNLFTES